MTECINANKENIPENKHKVLKNRRCIDSDDVLGSFHNIDVCKNPPRCHPDHRDQWGFQGYSEEVPFGCSYLFHHKNGGMYFNHTDELKKQKNVLGFLLKSMGKNLMSGKSIVNVSLPIKIFEPRSFLHRIADTWGFNTYYFNAAAAVTSTEERMKLVVTGVLAGLHLGGKQQKPFNPILGETMQGHFSDGTAVFMEQVSHHPPVSAFELVHPDGDWKFYGRHQYNADVTMNTCIGQQLGNNILEFADGTVLTWNIPYCTITGTMMGDRIVSWGNVNMEMEDRSSGLRCSVVFDRKERSGWSPFKKSVSGFKDSVDGTLYRHNRDDPNADREVLATLTGSWIRDLNWDDKLYWRLGSLNPDLVTSISDSDALKSDVRFREDLIALKEAEEPHLDKPQATKQKLEDLQRTDRKMRKSGAKLRKQGHKSQKKSQKKEAKKLLKQQKKAASSSS